MQVFDKAVGVVRYLDMYSEALEERNIFSVRKCLKFVFLLFHYGMGFYVLWLFKFQLDLHTKEDRGLELESLIETTWLVVGVLWGSIGWDIANELARSGDIRACVQRLVGLTFPWMVLVAGALHNFSVWRNYFAYDYVQASIHARSWCYASIVYLAGVEIFRQIVKRQLTR